MSGACFHGFLLSKSNFGIKQLVEGRMTTVFEDQIGTIEEGKLSDLVVTSGNPLDDIDLLCNSENIDLVMLGGNLVKGPAA
jgi:imidazolonepropionase-like amidohydrolase